MEIYVYHPCENCGGPAVRKLGDGSWFCTHCIDFLLVVDARFRALVARTTSEGRTTKAPERDQAPDSPDSAD